MPKKAAGEGVYRVIDIIGTSKRSWEEATKNAVETATRSPARPPDRGGPEARREDRPREDRRLSSPRPGLVQVRRLIGSGPLALWAAERRPARPAWIQAASSSRSSQRDSAGVSVRSRAATLSRSSATLRGPMRA